MSEKLWVKATAYVAAIAVIGATYYLAQTAIDAKRASLQTAIDVKRDALALEAYFDCIVAFSAFDWDRFPGEKPPAHEVCKRLLPRERP